MWLALHANNVRALYLAMSLEDLHFPHRQQLMTMKSTYNLKPSAYDDVIWLEFANVCRY